MPDSVLGLLPDYMTDRDAIELGCGTGYVSAWMARRGARVVGVDVSAEQLRTARRLAAHHGVDLTLVEASAENVPYPDASFDFAISEYGAAIWCDPHAWIPEAHRLLKPGGGSSCSSPTRRCLSSAARRPGPSPSASNETTSRSTVSTGGTIRAGSSSTSRFRGGSGCCETPGSRYSTSSRCRPLTGARK